MEKTTLARPSDAEVVDLTILQLTEQVQKRLASIEWLTGRSYPDARQHAAEISIEAVVLLHERGKFGRGRQAEAHAYAICNLLFGELDPVAEFWSTPLGADIAYAIGYPLAQVPTWGAAAVLNCTRIAVFKAVQRGQLELTPLSLRAYLRKSRKWLLWSYELMPDAAAMQPVRSMRPELARRVGS